MRSSLRVKNSLRLSSLRVGMFAQSEKSPRSEALCVRQQSQSVKSTLVEVWREGQEKEEYSQTTTEPSTTTTLTHEHVPGLPADSDSDVAAVTCREEGETRGWGHIV